MQLHIDKFTPFPTSSNHYPIWAIPRTPMLFVLKILSTIVSRLRMAPERLASLNIRHRALCAYSTVRK